MHFLWKRVRDCAIFSIHTQTMTAQQQQQQILLCMWNAKHLQWTILCVQITTMKRRFCMHSIGTKSERTNEEMCVCCKTCCKSWYWSVLYLNYSNWFDNNKELKKAVNKNEHIETVSSLIAIGFDAQISSLWATYKAIYKSMISIPYKSRFCYEL